MKQRVSFNQKIFGAMVLVMSPPSISTHVKTLSISICVNIIFVNIISTVSLCVTDLVPKSLSLSPQPNVSTIFLGGRYWHSSGAGQIGLTQIEKQIQKDKITPKTDFPSFFQTNVKSLLIKTMNMTDTEGVVFHTSHFRNNGKLNITTSFTTPYHCCTTLPTPFSLILCIFFATCCSTYCLELPYQHGIGIIS